MEQSLLYTWITRVCNTLSHKERVKPHRVKAITMTIQSNIISQIKSAQLEALTEEHVKEEGISGMEKQLEIKYDEARYFMNRVWVLKFRDVKELVLNQAHRTR